MLSEHGTAMQLSTTRCEYRIDRDPAAADALGVM